MNSRLIGQDLFGKGSLFGASEESNTAPTSFRYSVLNLLEVPWDLPSSVSLDDSAAICFTDCR
jgi:hypothetical protein